MASNQKRCSKCGHVTQESDASDRIVEGGMKGAAVAAAGVLFPPAGIAMGAAFVADSLNKYMNSNKCPKCGTEY